MAIHLEAFGDLGVDTLGGNANVGEQGLEDIELFGQHIDFLAEGVVLSGQLRHLLLGLSAPDLRLLATLADGYIVAFPTLLVLITGFVDILLTILMALMSGTHTIAAEVHQRNGTLVFAVDVMVAGVVLSGIAAPRIA